MRYLITFNDDRIPFFTDWVILENVWGEGMVIYDLNSQMYCKDGKEWFCCGIDHL